MKEFVVAAPGEIEFRDYTESPLKPDEVRVRSLVSGIKHGTELNLYRGKTPFLSKVFDSDYRMFVPQQNHSLYPMNLGSWLTGELVEIGSAVTRFKVGDKVHGPMPHRPTNITSAEMLFPLAKEMKPETALFTDPTIFALGAIHDAQIKIGDRVAIFGMGAIGLIALQLARLSGALEVFAVDTIPSRLELAKQFGADGIFNAKECDPALEIKNRTGKKGVDVALDISGSYAALHSAIRCIQMCGLIVSASYFSGTPQIELGAEWHHNRPTFRSSMPVWGNPHRCHPLWDFERLEATAVNLLESGKLMTDPIIGKRFQYQQAEQAYQFIDQHPDETIKTLFYYDSAS